MKFECLKDKLGIAINKAEKAIGKNQGLPVLSCILLDLKKNSLTVKATNLDIGVEVTVPVRGEGDGVVALPGLVFSSFVNTIQTDGGLVIEVKDGAVVAETPGFRASIKSLPGEDFPIIPRLETDKRNKIPAQFFIKGLKSVFYSSAVSGIKPELSSVCVYSSSSGLVFAATDSFRLAEKRIKTKDNKEFQKVLIPIKNVSEIIKIFEDFDGDLDIAVSNNQISLTGGAVYLTSRVIDASFPDYEKIIPKTLETEAVILKQDLIQVLRVANIFSDNFHQVNIKVVPSKKVLEIKTKNGVAGEVLNKLEAALSGSEVDVNFNFRYISDALQSIETDSVIMGFAGANKPMVLRGVGDSSFTYLVMPMNK